MVLLVSGPGAVGYIHGYYTADIGQMKAYQVKLTPIEDSELRRAHYVNSINISCDKNLEKVSNIRVTKPEDHRWRKNEPPTYRKWKGEIEWSSDPCKYAYDKRISSGYKQAIDAYFVSTGTILAFLVIVGLVLRYTKSEDTQNKSIDEGDN